jgi:hypothetical protein
LAGSEVEVRLDFAPDPLAAVPCWASASALRRLLAGDALTAIPDGVGGWFLVHPADAEPC